MSLNNSDLQKGYTLKKLNLLKTVSFMLSFCLAYSASASASILQPFKALETLESGNNRVLFENSTENYIYGTIHYTDGSVVKTPFIMPHTNREMELDPQRTFSYTSFFWGGKDYQCAPADQPEVSSSDRIVTWLPSDQTVTHCLFWDNEQHQ